MIFNLTCLTTLLLLTAGTISQIVRTAGYHRISENYVRITTFFAAIAQLATLYQLLHTNHGINLGLFNIFSMVTWVIILIVLISSLKEQSESLLIIVCPIAFISVLGAWLWPTEKIIINPLPLLIIHMLLSIIACGLLMASVCQCALLSWQKSQLRSCAVSTLARALPPLQTMEKLMFAFLLGGHILLALSLISGFIFYDNMFAANLLHKTILSIIAWCMFSVILIGHYIRGWRGNSISYWIIAGTLLITAAFLGWRIMINH